MKTFHKFTLLFLFLSIFNATLSCSSNDKTLPQPIPDIEEEEEETKDVVLPEDIQIIPYGGKASEYQPGSDIDKSYDGKFTQGISFESHYHSSWSNTSFPVTLEYFFKVQSPNQKIPDRKTKCVIKTHINIKQNVIFGAKLKPV